MNFLKYKYVFERKIFLGMGTNIKKYKTNKVFMGCVKKITLLKRDHYMERMLSPTHSNA